MILKTNNISLTCYKKAYKILNNHTEKNIVRTNKIESIEICWKQESSRAVDKTIEHNI